MAVKTERALPASVMAEARAIVAHGPMGADTGIIMKVRDGLRSWQEAPPGTPASDTPVQPVPGTNWSDIKVPRVGWIGDAA
ncbi:hypothetical protein GCM10023205_40570 [Yinghuangia aomiensis]|uniref:Uncharacterized protein n=1 Tax=Yinghuangia aomiensis TaxID=676205 RepID=A0ABP9HGZ0_9ACTN